AARMPAQEDIMDRLSNILGGDSGETWSAEPAAAPPAAQAPAPAENWGAPSQQAPAQAPPAVDSWGAPPPPQPAAPAPKPGATADYEMSIQERMKMQAAQAA